MGSSHLQPVAIPGCSKNRATSCCCWAPFLLLPAPAPPGAGCASSCCHLGVGTQFLGDQSSAAVTCPLPALSAQGSDDSTAPYGLGSDIPVWWMWEEEGIASFGSWRSFSEEFTPSPSQILALGLPCTVLGSLVSNSCPRGAFQGWEKREVREM